MACHTCHHGQDGMATPWPCHAEGNIGAISSALQAEEQRVYRARMQLDLPNSPAEPPDAERATVSARATSLARPRRLQAIVEVFLIFCLFFVYAAWPAPDVNETHYLCKIKQAWNADWLPGDFFLNTPDAHPVFTWTCGWPTLFLS